MTAQRIQTRSERYLDDVLADVFFMMDELSAYESRDAAIAFAVNKAAEVLRGETAAGFYLPPGSMTATCVAAVGKDADDFGFLTLPVAGSVLGLAKSHGVTIAISDMSGETRLTSAFGPEAEFVTRSVLCAPVEHDGCTRGAIAVINRSAHGSWSAGEVEILTYIAKALARYLAETEAGVESSFEPMSSRRPYLSTLHQSLEPSFG